MADHLQGIQERDGLVLPRASCVFQDKLGDADGAQGLIRGGFRLGRGIETMFDHEPLLVPGQESGSDLVRLEERDLLPEPHLVATQRKRDLTEWVQWQNRGSQE